MRLQPGGNSVDRHWAAALVVFALTSVLMLTGGWMMTPMDRYLEDKFTAVPAGSAQS